MEAISFKQRIRARELLIGTFVKTGHHQVVEILGASGLDLLVVDAEHAPFDRASLDALALAARASGIPTLVRLPDTTAPGALSALDSGYTGVLSPHAKTREGAAQIVRNCRYREGIRGFSNSSRAGAYGAISMREHIEKSDSTAVVICQIEDREAVDNLDELVQVEGVDCYLIGRADLAVSLGCTDIGEPSVTTAVRRVIDACADAQKPVGLFVADARDIAQYSEMGVSMFIVGSDQSMLRAQASSIVRNAKTS